MNFKREKYIYHSIILLVAKILLLSTKTTLNYGCMYESEKKTFKHQFFQVFTKVLTT